jgi:tetratricopeptide (TPR) repeat protein
MNNPSINNNPYLKLNKWDQQYDSFKVNERWNRCLKIQKKILNYTANLVDYRRINNLSLLRIAEISYRLKRYEEAYSYYKKALKQLSKSTDEIKPVVYRIYEGLHRTTYQLKRDDDSIKYGMMATYNEKMHDLKRIMVYRRMMQSIIRHYENNQDNYVLIQGAIYFIECISLFEKNQLVDSFYYKECLEWTALLYRYLKEDVLAERYEAKVQNVMDLVLLKRHAPDIHATIAI